MRRDFTLRKRIILGAVIVLVLCRCLLLRLQLAAFLRSARAPAAPGRGRKQHELLKADIERAQKIRDNIPANQKECDRFRTIALSGELGLFRRHI